MSKIKRENYNTIKSRLMEPLSTIQIIVGPRQVGKTTLIKQIINELKIESAYHTADSPRQLDDTWISQHWATARLLYEDQKKPIILCFDEIQKVHGWSEIVKKYFDEDRFEQRDIRVVLSGSSTAQIDTGLLDSLTGRFERHILTHWTYSECKKAFGINLEDYIRYGGYPGAYEFMNDSERWVNYVQDALIEPVISKDILMKNPVRKPALLKQLFNLICLYGGQVISYQKLIGQLQDAGNVTTLAHYQDLIEQAMLIKGLQKYSGSKIRERASSPKWIPLNTALMTAISLDSPRTLIPGSPEWGHWVETAIGAHLINQSIGTGLKVNYWREGHKEVDFVLSKGDQLIGIEVKSGPDTQIHPGLKDFQSKYPHAKVLKIGGDGLGLEDFFTRTPKTLIDI